MYGRRLISAGVGVTAAGVLVFGIGGTANAAPKAQSCPDGQMTEQGVCAAAVTDPVPTALQVEQQAGKDQAKATAEAQLRETGSSTGTSLVTPMNQIDAGGGAVVKLSEVTGMGLGPLYKEGQGNNKAHWTCGPAATRNMVAAMYKHRDGTYKDFGEAQFATWEGTTTSGTARANVAAALNNHFSAFGHWTTSRPVDKLEYLSDVISDTQYHQSVIANIDTEELNFWNSKALDHFDFVFGYDTTDSTTKYIWVGEEWDPIYIYGSSSYGNPYGFHKVTLASAFRAVNKTSIHGVVS